MSSNFTLHDTDSETDLPFPTPLPRSSFLSPTFTPTTLLSSLTTRHQTLSDLRAELTTRSQSIAAELLSLVNNEYQAFLGLGSDLKGGGDKVDEVIVGVLGFQKGVRALRDVVAERAREVEGVLEERRRVRRDVAFGRGLLSVAGRVEELEEALALGEGEGKGEEWSEDEVEEDDDEDLEEGDEVRVLVNVARLRRLVHLFVTTRRQVDQLGGAKQPFLATLTDRIRTIRQTLLIDLGTALKQAKELKKPGGVRTLKIMQLFSDMDETAEALRVLKSIKK